jgi:protein TonB
LPVEDIMFEQSIVEFAGRTTRPWTVAVSFLGQIVLIGCCILVPLVYTEALPRIHSIPLLPPPMGAQTKRLPVEKPPKTLARPWNNHSLTAPARIPEQVARIQDPPATLIAGGNDSDTGVPGGLGNVANAVIESVLRQTPKITEPASQTPKEVSKPKSIERVRVGGVVRMPKLVRGPQPVYPQLAKQARISGVVRLEAIIGKDGTIRNLRAVSGHPLLVPAALEAVGQWLYEPTQLNGDPVEVATEIEVNFTLRP